MNKYSWSFDRDAYFYHGGSSVEDCLEQARELAKETKEKIVYIGKDAKFDPKIDKYMAKEILEMIEQEAYDFDDEESWGWEPSSVNDKALTELGEMLTPVVIKWLEKHNLMPDIETVTNVKRYSLIEEGKR